MVNVLIDIPNEIHKRIKMLAAVEEIPMKDEIIKMLGDLVYIDDLDSWKDMLADMTTGETEKKEKPPITLSY